MTVTPLIRSYSGIVLLGSVSNISKSINSDNAEYKIIVPSAVCPFGGEAIGYLTYLGKVETDEY